MDRSAASSPVPVGASTEPDVVTVPGATVSDRAHTASDPVPRLGTGPVGTALRIVVAVGVLLAANLAAGLVAALAALVPGAPELLSGQSPWAFVLAVVMQALVLGVVVLAVRVWMRWIERSTIRAAGWRWSRRSIVWMLLGIAVAGGSVVAVTAVLPPTGPPLGGEALLGSQTATPAAVTGLAAYFLGLAFLQQGIPEELLFRGWLTWRLRHRPVIAVIVTTLAFTVIHLVSNGGQQSAWEHVIYLALPFGFGLLAAGLLLWTGSLWAAVGVHGGFHVGNYLAMAMLPQVDAAGSWLAVGGVQALTGVVLTATALRRGKRFLDSRD